MLTTRRVAVLALMTTMALVFSVLAVRGLQSQPPPEPVTAVSPPADQTYTGAKQCASCHFKQFMSWKKTKHAKEAFQSLPAKYQADPECVKCHATGSGAASGFKDAATTPNLAGTTCEACHGPGSKHEAIAKQFANKKKLDPEEEKSVRGSIYKVLPQNVCMRCHVSQTHGEHPKYDKQ
ncbi:MAG: cytochrome c family protein [Thermoguttaceae bacterium]